MKTSVKRSLGLGNIFACATLVAGLSLASLFASTRHAEANPGLCASSEVTALSGWDCETLSLNLAPGEKVCIARFNCRAGGMGEVRTHNTSGSFSSFLAQSGPESGAKRSFSGNCGQAVDAYCRGQYD